MVQIVLLASYFAFWGYCFRDLLGSDFVISTIRSLRILNEILLCYLLAEIVFEESAQNRLATLFKVIGAFVFVEWFWTAVISNDEYE